MYSYTACICMVVTTFIKMAEWLINETDIAFLKSRLGPPHYSRSSERVREHIQPDAWVLCSPHMVANPLVSSWEPCAGVRTNCWLKGEWYQVPTQFKSCLAIWRRSGARQRGVSDETGGPVVLMWYVTLCFTGWSLEQAWVTAGNSDSSQVNELATIDCDSRGYKRGRR